MLKISYVLLIFLVFSILTCHRVHAQDSLHNMAKPLTTVFIPFQLDSAFVNGQPVHTKSMPPSLMNSLDFYNGIQIAVTELLEQGVAARIRIVDSKSPDFLDQYFRDTTYEGNGIVISAASSAAELKTIAEKLRPTRTPLITILPNDAGISGYPEMMLANPTLRTHCEQLQYFLQRNHSIDKIVMLTISGNAETRLIQYLKEANKKTRSIPLKWTETVFTDNLTPEMMALSLDSNRMNIIIAPTLNPINGQKIAKLLSALAPKYRTAVFGMPTWETVNFAGSEYYGVDVWYGTPFVTSTGNVYLNDEFIKKYRTLTNSKPGDMAYRGYEITMRYVKTFAAYGPRFLDHINDFQFRMFNDFNFQEVSLRDNGQTDYLENQKIYFVKKTDGVIKTVLTP